MGKYGEDLTPEEQSEVDRELEEVAEDMIDDAEDYANIKK